jgi:phytol kinase
MLGNNYIALIITFVVSLVWLRINDYLAHRGWISSHLSRKIIHIGTGPLYVACWLLFNDAAVSRYLAALVPFVITVQFFLVGTGLIHDEAAVQAMSRSGDRREILRGPLFYGILFVILTIMYWKDSPIGMVALMLMCGGDGLAEILGRQFGTTKIPWNPDKSLIGSIGMFLGGWVLSAFILSLYIAAGIFIGPFNIYLTPLTIIALSGTLIESLPFHDIDNITVTLTAVLLGNLLFR